MSIRVALFLSHLALCILLVTGLGIRRYDSEVDLMMSAATEVAETTAAPIIDRLLPAISGNNYQIAQLPQAEQAYDQAPRLRFFRVTGLGERNATPFALNYSRDAGRSWRSWFPVNYASPLQERLRQIEEAEALENANLQKLAFVRARTEHQLAEYRLAQQLGSRYAEKFNRLRMLEDGSYFDKKRGQLHLRMPIIGLANGEIWLIFDASDLNQRLNELFVALAMEIGLAVLLSSLLILAGTVRLVRPLQRLATTMRQEPEEIDVDAVPDIARSDEIGVLARRFAALIARVQGQLAELRKISVTDPLTKLPTRRYFDEAAPALMNVVRRQGGAVALAIIDADRFKLFNDRYGHSAGDDALVAVADCLRQCFSRETDVVARFGGEEFVVLSKVDGNDQAYEHFDRFRIAVRELNILHDENEPDYIVTASIGIDLRALSHHSRPPELAEMLRSADTALYLAKDEGRDRIVMTGAERLRNDATRSGLVIA